MAITEQLQPAERSQWRKWLAENHANSKGVWFIFCKKGSGLPTLAYEEAIEEALCFGWIDSTVRKLDDKRYQLQFCPRRDRANWSEPNRKRLIKLLATDLMTPAGLAAIAPQVMEEIRAGKLTPESAKLPVPKEFADALKADKIAAGQFEKLPPSCRQQYVQWIASAKRDETCQRRIDQSIEMLQQGKRLMMDGKMQATSKAAPKPVAESKAKSRPAPKARRA